MSRQPILLSILLPFILPAMAATPAPSSLPAVDFSRMGTVGLGGSFAGLDWWTDQSPFTASSSSTAASSSSARFSSEGDTVFVKAGDGSYRPIGVTNTGGRVTAICYMSEASGSGNGTIFVGGAFSTIGDQTSPNIASYSLATSSWRSIASGLPGPLNALYCDGTNSRVWLGGGFANPNGNGSNVALWSTTASSWQTVPFNGLNAPVTSISLNSANNHLLFSGSFTTSFSSTSYSNRTSTNYTSTPSAPSNTSTSGNSGYLTPVSLPATSSAEGSLTITAGPSTEDSRYNDGRVMLCPGSGTWLAREGQVSEIDLLGYNFWRASGARLSNARVLGRGTTSFCITSIPDNVELNMTYTDPATGRNMTCDEHCPLSTDSSVGAQDFVFTDGPRNMTGLKMQLKSWIGDGAGLSGIQLLSPGAYASAAPDGNKGVCPGAPTSNVQTTGDWTQGTVETSLPATTAFYIKSTTPSPPSTYPSITFYPRVSSAGYYEVYLAIPACSKTEDCGSRTTTDVEVFPRLDGSGWTSTISQITEVDERVLIYSGWIDATSPEFSPTVILALARNPQGTSSGSYSVVAQSVEMVLIGVGSPGSTPQTSAGGIVGQNGTLITNSNRSVGSRSSSFGVFEWTPGSAGINAFSGNLPNSTETALTKLGYTLGSARNQSTGSRAWNVNAIVPVGNTLYVAGQFSQANNWTNVIGIDTGSNSTSSLSNGGLNGPVHAAIAVGNAVYFGGNFTGTATGGVNLRYIARYDTASRAWSAVVGGVDGPVTDLSVSNNRLLVTGNFTRTIAADGSSSATGGYAVYDTSSSSWSNSGILFGTVGAVTPGNSDNTFLAGRVYGSSGNSVNGIAMLSTGKSGAEISTLPGVAFSSSGSASSTTAQTRRRALSGHSSKSMSSSRRRSWYARLSEVLSPLPLPIRDLGERAPAPTIPSSNVTAPAVLAGGFWTNASASGRPQITVLGGNFSTTNSIGGLAFYSASTSALSGPVPPVQGVVRSLAVVSDTVYAAGSGVNVTGVGSGLVAYDLANNRWSTNRIPTLNPAIGQALVVNSIKRREDTNTVVVAGNFISAGSLSCAALCLWDVAAGQWSLPGSGLSSGEVRAIDFADDKQEILIAVGSFVLSSGAVSYAASYSFSSREWTSLGTLPGPALALAVDNKNSSSLFASGYADSGNTPYLSQWTGSNWVAQNATLLPGSVVSQLAFVPLQSEHSGSGLIERDRMLMMSGNLNLESTGNVTSALFDGSKIYPYLVGITASGGIGAASSLFWSESSFDFTIRRYLAVGLVVLIAIAIATGLILLLILLFLLVSYCLRRRERNSPQQEMYNKDPAEFDHGSAVSSTHQNVLHTVQNAIEATLIGASPAAAIAAAKHRPRDTRVSDVSHYPDDPPAGAMAGGGVGAGAMAREAEEEEEEEDEDQVRETTMRYDFDGPELQPGEMSMRAGQKVVVLDDQQSEEWWYCRDPASGREGVVPATYVW